MWLTYLLPTNISAIHSPKAYWRYTLFPFVCCSEAYKISTRSTNFSLINKAPETVLIFWWIPGLLRLFTFTSILPKKHLPLLCFSFCIVNFLQFSRTKAQPNSLGAAKYSPKSSLTTHRHTSAEIKITVFIISFLPLSFKIQTPLVCTMAAVQHQQECCYCATPVTVLFLSSP